MDTTAEAIIRAIQSRGSDATNLRDAAHEACHALEFGVPDGKWGRESIDRAGKRKWPRLGDAFASEVLARAVEQVVCADLGVDRGTVESCVLIACMEAMKFDRVNYPFAAFVALVKKVMAEPRAREMADRIKALPSVTVIVVKPRARRARAA